MLGSVILSMAKDLIMPASLVMPDLNLPVTPDLDRASRNP